MLVIGCNITEDNIDTRHRLVTSVGGKSCSGDSLGVVMISGHPSPVNTLATLRIYTELDTLAFHLARFINMLTVLRPDTRRRMEHVSVIPYDEAGLR